MRRAIQKIRALGDRPQWSKTPDGEWFPDFAWDTPIYRAHADAEAQKRARGRPGHGPDHFRAVAILYLELYAREHRSILKEIARQYEVAPETARDWVHRARTLGYLTPGVPGRRGAEPGTRLLTEITDAYNELENQDDAANQPASRIGASPESLHSWLTQAEQPDN